MAILGRDEKKKTGSLRVMEGRKRVVIYGGLHYVFRGARQEEARRMKVTGKRGNVYRKLSRTELRGKR